MRAGPPVSGAGHEQLAALGHGRAGAADRVGLVEIGDRVDERRRRNRADRSESTPRGLRDHIDLAQCRMLGTHLAAQLRQRVERQRLAKRAGQCPQDRPILAGLARRKYRAAA
jgi:hypothetical protein